VLVEGFDDPATECVLLARPTTSPLVYTQCLGRGLRPAPGKQTCTIIDIVDRAARPLQYGASQMAGLSSRWDSRGRDPCRESRAIEQIRVTDPNAFLAIRKAASLEEVQSILMCLPPETVLAGLDGEPVVRYDQVERPLDPQEVRKQILALLRQAGAQPRRLSFDDGVVTIVLPSPEVQNERFGYLRWHLERATGWTIRYKPAPTGSRCPSNPRSLLRSMITEGHRISRIKYDAKQNFVRARLSGMTDREADRIVAEFERASGVELELQGQLAFGF
jgi:hypothetical protein